MTIDDSAYDEFSPDESSPLISTSVQCEVTIDGLKIGCDILGLELSQFIDSHHVLSLTIGELGLSSKDQEIDAQIPYTTFLGKSISLSIDPIGDFIDNLRKLSFIGVVTQVDLKNNINEVNIGVITAHSPTIVLDGAPRNEFYYEQKASDIISSVLSGYPMTITKTEATQGQKEYCVQYRETDYNFIARLAGENGLFAYYDGQGFSVAKAASGDVEDLIWRETLGSFSLGLGTAPVKFSSQAYNYLQKRIFTQDTESLSAGGALSELSRLSPDASKELYQQTGFAGSSRQVADASSLDRILNASRGHAMGKMIKCSGTSNVPAVAVGHCIRVKGMGKIDATYWVLSVRHTIDNSGTYYNNFCCTPLDMAFPQYKSSLNRVTQLQSAVVTNNVDPDKLGRIKVTFPWSDSKETSWIRVITPHAGNERGFFHIPEIDDEVMVGYVQGNPDRPIIVGSVYNGVDKPQEGVGEEGNNVKSFKTRCGHELIFDDTDGEEKITITAKDGSQIVIDAANSSISIKSEKDISIEGTGDLLIKATNISIEADAEMKIKSGSDMSLDAGASMKSKAAGTSDVEGATVNVKGSMINLN